ncbi:hypothetical protein Q4Q35_19655 [Flavivirga aquimarina]|uniref:Nal1 N-terminal domain-containing protein n=1 Tax=Flavivirga aquimarina TaxID=2027862 RepID=A0ABT8WG14_9FLAO|nr:hypothetical protein [Flavivirga aquimarina]MDO5972022.1 hypothetical protein [Flavivirga aquimarina]
MDVNKFQKHRLLTRTVKKQHIDQWLFKNQNVVGMSYGRKIVHNKITDEPALVVYVMKKLPKQFIPPSQLLPSKVFIGGDYIHVDVVETGPFNPLAFTARERPAPSGISIGHPNITAGTLGCLVKDLTDGSTCILSNNHVLADQNAASIGDNIIQPGSADGGVVPSDVIAQLKRFQIINATGNIMDAAIAEVNNIADVINQMKNNLMDVPSPNHPAVGLLFAGSCSRTIMNPIQDVLDTLQVDFINGGPGATVPGEIDMNVEKVGRTTEYTSSTIMEIDATVTIGYDFGSATFDDQIVTAWMSDGGDSGSIVCRGGEGGNEDHCGSCQSTQSASIFLKKDLRSDVAAEKSFREKHLIHTLTGRYVVDTFFDNEDYLNQRFKDEKIGEEDAEYARYLYDKYAKTFRNMALDIESNEKIPSNVFKEAEKNFGRLKRYLSKSEQSSAESLFKLAYEFEGKTTQEALKMLDDKRLYNQVVKIVSGNDTLRKKDC